MPLYTITSDDEHLQHSSELDLPDDGAARAAALSALPDMARDEIPDGDRRIFSITVANAKGHLLYRATLTLVGEWCREGVP